MPVTFSCLEKISGIISTPTLNDFAVKNGDGLNFGSSPMERFFAVSAPPSSDKLKSPTCTLRPRASDAFSSMVGRKRFTGIRKGAMISKTSRTPTAIRI
jgi:hypothetical protein